MSKLPVVNGREIVKALKRAGFEKLRQRGSHVTLIRREDQRVVVVPVHGGRDVLPQTLRGILKQAGLTPDEFRQLLERR